MRVDRIWIIVGILATAALAAGLATVLPAHSQSAASPQVVTGAVGETISYQGQLTDDEGAPLNGTYTMVFRLYPTSSGGAPIYESGPLNVNVDEGLFRVSLDAPQSAFDGGALWLAIEIEGEVLSPRQEIQPAPYAMSLRPGALIRNAATGTAVRVESQDVALYGAGDNFGVYGLNEGSANGRGYGGYFESSTGSGVFGSSTAVPSTTNSVPAGVYGYSENGAGVYGESGTAFAWGGYFDGNVKINGSLVITGDLFVDGSKSGYVVDLALNDGDRQLERGDIVVVSGVAAPVVGDLPVPLVQQTEAEASPAVIGVVDRRYELNDDGHGRMEEGPAAPGDYLSIVTVGAFPTIKVDATYGPIEPGDLLVSSPTPGHAMRAADPGIGTVVGKALGALDEGTGAIAVMITLQ